MHETTGFTGVREGEECVVVIAGQRYELGFVHRIHATHPKYIVWADKKSKIWYEIDHRALTLSTQFHAYWNRWQDVMCQSLHNLNRFQRKTFFGMLASSLSSALENEIDSALEALRSVRKYLSSANDTVSKRRYVFGVIGSTAISCAIAISFWYFINPLHDKFLWILMLSIGGGCIGALLSSTSGKIQDTRFDPSASRLDGYMNGALRVLYGVCGALVAVVAVRSGIVSSQFITPDNEHLVLLLVAMAGGFTERNAANIIRRFSDDRGEASPSTPTVSVDQAAPTILQAAAAPQSPSLAAPTNNPT